MKTPTIRYRPIIVFAAAFFACSTLSCGKEKSEPVDETQPSPTPSQAEPPIALHKSTVEAMGTFFNFTVATRKSDADVNTAIEAAYDEIRRIEQMMTTHREESALSKVNRSAGRQPVAAPQELLTLVQRAIEISERTEGKFDVTFGAVGRLWDFKTPPPSVPSPTALEKALPLLDYRKIVVDTDAATLFLREEGMSIGLGAIAKGYAVDRAAAILKERGFDDFIVYGGGDIYFSGKKGEAPWRVGIQDPRTHGSYFADFPMNRNGAVVTSGDYEKYITVDGKRYHHILDPDTGYPAEGTVSVTLITESAAEADALATGIFVLGPDKGMALIESDPKLEGVIVDTTLTPRVSSGLKASIDLRPISQPEKEASK